MTSSQPDEPISAVKPAEKLIWKNWNFDDWLWFFTVIGVVLRFFFPIMDNPFSHMFSDSERHFRSATEALDFGIYSISDSLGYQVWLGAAARIFGNSRPVVGVYAGSLSVVTTYAYYLWFQLCLPSKRCALVAYLIIVWMPDWIKIYTYFLDETLLLPLVGFMLYFGWKAKLTHSYKDCMLLGAFAGLSFITKATCAPLIAVTYVLVFLNILERPIPFTYKLIRESNVTQRILPSIALAAAITMLAPISFHSRTGSWSWFLPGQARSNALYFQSGKKMMKVSNRYFDRLSGQWKDEEYWFGCPSYYTKQLVPFSEWISPREGEFVCKIDYGAPPERRFSPSKIDLPWRKKIELTLENCVYVLVGFVWPAEYPYSIVNFERWLWPIFTLLILAAAIKRRKFNELDCMCFAMLGVLMFQQECGVEGRYRMVWEGVVIPALVLAMRSWLLALLKWIKNTQSALSALPAEMTMQQADQPDIVKVSANLSVENS